MPNVKMSKTVHASWKLASGENESDRFDTTVDDLFQALQQAPRTMSSWMEIP